MADSFDKLKDALQDLTFDHQVSKGAENATVVEAASIEEGLQKASEEMGVSISELEYEILQYGKKGLFKSQPYKLLVKSIKQRMLDRELMPKKEVGVKSEPLRRDRDGSFKIKITRVGLMLKVTAPRGRGHRIRVEDVLALLRNRGISEFDKSKIVKIVREAEGEYVKIGTWVPDPRNAGRVVVEVSDDEMKAFATLIPPKPLGRVLDIDDVLEALNEKGVVVGIKQKVIQEALEDEVYNIPLVVAEGTKPVNGEDAKIVYHFRVEKKVHFLEDEKGQVNYKDLDLVENVVAGQLLATKVQATEGVTGRTVTNRLLDAKSGKDINLVPGKNTEPSADGMSLTSTINGQVVVSNDKINVEPVYEVKGDVDMHTGNILFLGTVIVKGNVEDGFSIKAAGDIEIKGSVGKCVLDAEGDINIRQGVMGKLGGTIKAGGSIWAKFLEQVNVVADKSVFVQDGIMHCNVDATEKVVCFGRRATIVGGKIRAGEIVTTKTLGSVSFTETLVEVGVDPKSRHRLHELDKEKTKNEEELEKLNANLNTLQNQKRIIKQLSEEKEKLLENMLTSREETIAALSEINEEMEELKSYLKLLKTIGKVSVSKNVFPGVRIGIKDIYFDVTNEFKYVTFVLDGGRIRIKKYEEIDLEAVVGKRIK